MAWHKDKQIEADASIFRSLFPEQTKTPARIAIWSVILLVDIILCVYGAFSLGIINIDHFSKLMIALVLIAAVALFWLQGVIYGAIVKLVKKS